MLKQDEVLQILKTTGTIKTGHFQLTSGNHSLIYLEKFEILQYPTYTAQLCEELAKRFQQDNIQLVVGPTTGGIILSYEIARALGTRAIFAEHEEGKRVFRRGFKIKKGERVLVVDDMTTTGGTIKEVIKLVQQHKGKVVGVAMLVDRTGGKLDFGVKTERLLATKIEDFPPHQCPLCKKGIPITKPGGGKSA